MKTTTIPNRLKTMRIMLGLNRRQMALVLGQGWTAERIKNYESGRNRIHADDYRYFWRVVGSILKERVVL
jgi:transcriptional regulator with XRE-family HTH domain